MKHKVGDTIKMKNDRYWGNHKLTVVAVIEELQMYLVKVDKGHPMIYWIKEQE